MCKSALRASGGTQCKPWRPRSGHGPPCPRPLRQKVSQQTPRVDVGGRADRVRPHRWGAFAQSRARCRGAQF
eukprot:5179221-Alexandrium_andersonii.AAC.1